MDLKYTFQFKFFVSSQYLNWKKADNDFKLRETSGLSETQNMDLTYQVLFNLAVQEETNELYAEALNHYQIIVKNKLFQQVGKIRVNMGNIYFKTKEYNKAVKVSFILWRLSAKKYWSKPLAQ